LNGMIKESDLTQKIIWLLLAITLIYGLYQVISLAWIGDDAFISFRYAKNLVEGHGLVFNIGERVEGYTNFLWTILIALGMLLGIDPLIFSQVLSIGAYLFTVFVLVYLSYRIVRDHDSHKSVIIPVAALAILLMHDYNIYATSGLETSLTAALITAGFTALVMAKSKRGILLGGYILILAALTRPDAMIFYIMGIPYIFMLGKEYRKDILIYLIPLVSIYVPYWIIRYAYYGYPFPNTYYAKVAYMPYWSQGLAYLFLYVRTYYILILLPVAMIAVIPIFIRSYLSSLKVTRLIGRTWLLGILFIVPYVLYVVRSGGDFMFARFFIPIAPLCFFFLESAIMAISRRIQARAAIAAVVLLAVFFSWNQYDTPRKFINGIVDERSFYPAESIEQAKVDGHNLQKYLDGLDVTLGFYGSKAMTVYYSDLPDAVELQTGLTDEYIAHRPIKRRGRPGHEKMAPHDYILKRGINFILKKTDVLPADRTRILLLDSTIVHVVFYDNSVMESLKRYPKVQFVDFPSKLDSYIENIKLVPRDRLINDYSFFRLYYFDHNVDPARNQPFIDRLNELETGG
jgi:hypothetical protein